jgi:hypothetical protein
MRWIRVAQKTRGRPGASSLVDSMAWKVMLRPESVMGRERPPAGGLGQVRHKRAMRRWHTTRHHRLECVPDSSQLNLLTRSRSRRRTSTSNVGRAGRTHAPLLATGGSAGQLDSGLSGQGRWRRARYATAEPAERVDETLGVTHPASGSAP